MSETRRLARVRITHDMLTEMVRRTLVVRDTWTGQQSEGVEIKDLTVVGTAQDLNQLFRRTVDIFLESPELRASSVGCELYIMKSDLKETP